NSQSLGETIPEVTFQILPKETKVSHNYIIAQDFIQDVTSKLIDEDDIQIIMRIRSLQLT
ncbi:3024_t:CDS:1, partial [Rhizophagus irregularis]